ncbi:MAG: hypothetical protein ACTH2Q_18175 [Propionibacteriaceae bacterium]
MSNQPYGTQSPVTISAGTAIKIGFFGSLGAVLFSLILGVIALVVSVVLAAVGFSMFNQF